MREALGMIGGDTSRAKMPATQSNLKLAPLPPPKCFGAITQHLSNSPAPYVGLQVHVFNIWMQSTLIRVRAKMYILKDMSVYRPNLGL